MLAEYNKAIAAAIIAVVGLLALIFHWSIPGWLTETNIMQVLVVVTPIIVAWIPNKATAQQKAEAAAAAPVPMPPIDRSAAPS